MDIKFLSFAIICSFIDYATSSNILGLFPHPGYSHFKVFYPILRGLSNQGHTITVVTYVKTNTNSSNYKEFILTGEDTKHIFSFDNFEPSRSWFAMFQEFFALHYEGKRACKVFYDSGVVEQILKTHKSNPFDLIITENFNTDCYYGISEVLDLPVVALSSCVLMPWLYSRAGIPDTPSYIPAEFVGSSERMTFFERFTNFIITKGCSALYKLTEISDNKIIKTYLNIDIDIANVVIKRTKLFLLNQHYSLSGSRPNPSNVIEVGGIHIQDDDEKIIPNDIEEFLQNSPNGLIFISWGSMIKTSSMSEKKSNEIIRALEKLPYNILWKWESDQIPSSNSKKFKFVKWAPQKELLCHPKIKIFWGHGGLLGSTEAVHCSKPAIITPLYGDQFLNGRAMENRQVGIILLHQDINEENILRVFNEIGKSKYADNAKYLSNEFRKRQNSPLDTALWWVNKIIQTKGPNLAQSPVVEMTGFVYHSLDVISVLFVILFIIFISLIYCFKHLTKAKTPKIVSKSKKNKKKIKSS